MHDLGTLGGDYANANGMNNLDHIVGYSYLADNVTTHAFIAGNGVMTDLNSLVPVGSGFTLTAASGINDQGDIVANGVNSSGVDHAFLLTPQVTPEPPALSILAPAIVLLARRNHASRQRPRRSFCF
jgi:probable HAF family extracellular repeat protein